MRKNFLIIFKIGLLIVLVGFFCPVSCNMNGLEIIKFSLTYHDAYMILILGIPFSVILLFSILALFFTKNNGSKNQDFWRLFLPNFLAECFLIVYCRNGISGGTVVLNFGFYVMALGYILSLVSLICASFGKDKGEKTDG